MWQCVFICVANEACAWTRVSSEAGFASLSLSCYLLAVCQPSLDLGNAPVLLNASSCNTKRSGSWGLHGEAPTCWLYQLPTTTTANANDQSKPANIANKLFCCFFGVAVGWCFCQFIIYQFFLWVQFAKERRCFEAGNKLKKGVTSAAPFLYRFAMSSLRNRSWKMRQQVNG